MSEYIFIGLNVIFAVGFLGFLLNGFSNPDDKGKRKRFAMYAMLCLLGLFLVQLIFNNQ